MQIITMKSFLTHYYRFYSVLLLSAAFCSVAHAEPADAPLDGQQFQQLLKKMQSAAQTLHYSGTFVHQQGQSVRASRIAHMVAGGNELEKLEILDGKPREYVRRNDEVTRYFPDSQLILVEHSVARDVFPSILVGNSKDLSKVYKASQQQENERVAGVLCRVMTLTPENQMRYGYRLWADMKTGLMLKAQTLDKTGSVVEQIAFTHIDFKPLEPAQLAPTYTHTSGWRRREAAVSEQVDLSAWKVEVPIGFRQIQAVRHRISSGSGTVVVPNGDRELSQLVFSDGLAAISVFIEPDVASRTEGEMRQGAMSIIGRRKDGYWLTVMGEVPVEAVRQVINSIRLTR